MSADIRGSQVIEEYVEDPDSCPDKTHWAEYGVGAGDNATSRLSFLRDRVILCDSELAKTAYLLGTLLKLGSTLKTAMAYGPTKDVWESAPEKTTRGAPHPTHTIGDEPTDGGENEATPNMADGIVEIEQRTSPEMEKLQDKDNDSDEPLEHGELRTAELAHAGEESVRQALQNLTDAVHGALVCGNLDVAEHAASEIVDLLGACTPTNSQKSAEYLALYQSCRARRRLAELGSSMLPHASVSARKLRQRLARDDERDSIGIEGSQLLKVHADAINSSHKLLNGVRCLVLQPNSAGDALYGAVLRSNTNSHATVSCKIPIDPQALVDIQRQMSTFKVAREAAVSKAQDRGQGSKMNDEARSEPPENESALSDVGDSGETAEDRSHASLGSDVNMLLREVIPLLERVLSPLLDKLMPSLVGPHDNGTHVVLLVDESLFSLPFELLPALQNPHIGSVTRDFSIEVLRNRIAASINTVANDSGKKGGKKSSTEAVVAQTSSTTYAVDPRVAFSQQNQGTTNYVEVFSAMTNGLPGRSSWRSAVPTDGSFISAGHFHRSVEKSEVFVHFGPGTLLSELNTSVASTLPLDHCKAALLLDRCSIDAIRGSHVAGHVDNFDEVFALVGLLTLRGALLIGLNQWASSAEENGNCGKAIISAGCATLSGCIGNAVQHYHLGVDPEVVHAKGKSKDKKVGVDPGKVEAQEPPDLARLFNFTTFGLPNVTLE